MSESFYGPAGLTVRVCKYFGPRLLGELTSGDQIQRGWIPYSHVAIWPRIFTFLMYTTYLVPIHD